MCALASVVCVLFVGNSLTEANGLPAMVARLATVQVDARVAGGYALEDHWKLGGVRELIANGHYDVGAVQEVGYLPFAGVGRGDADIGADLHQPSFRLHRPRDSAQRPLGPAARQARAHRFPAPGARPA